MPLASPTTDLPTRRLGESPLEVSVVGLGCNNFGRRLDLDRTAAVLEAALAAGITLFDTADTYGGAGESERLMGEALQGRREEYLLATKFGMDMSGAEGLPDVPRGSREYIRRAVEGSLRLDELVGEGLVIAIGCSNFSAAELEQAERTSRELGLARFETLQNHYSLLDRGIEAEVAPACERLGVSILPFFPLEKGLLSGKYRRGEPAPEGSRLAAAETIASDAQFDVVEAIEAFAHKRGIETIDVAIAGLAAQPAVASVIAGATRPEQVAANVATVNWQPTAEDLAELDRIAPTPRG
jgi:aryl-alcohol dehydrogenase-like predicted oxidoreductase